MYYSLGSYKISTFKYRCFAFTRSWRQSDTVSLDLTFVNRKDAEQLWLHHPADKGDTATWSWHWLYLLPRVIWSRNAREQPWWSELTRLGGSPGPRRLLQDTSLPPGHCPSAESAVLDYPVRDGWIVQHISRPKMVLYRYRSKLKAC